MKTVLVFDAPFRAADLTQSLAEMMPIGILILPRNGALAAVCRRWAIMHKVHIVSVPLYPELYLTNCHYMQARAMCRTAIAVSAGHDAYKSPDFSPIPPAPVVALILPGTRNSYTSCAKNYHIQTVAAEWPEGENQTGGDTGGNSDDDN
jgi:hypothetical protein